MNFAKDFMLADKHATSSFTECEFCNELTNPRFSRFGKMYSQWYETRIVAEQDDLVAMPTVGQLFKGSLLIMPRMHFETMAELPSSMLKVLITILEHLENRIAPFGTPILFEHGAKCKTGAGCGIYHAHMHLVPVPGDINCADVLPNRDWITTTLFDAYDRLLESENYLLFCDTTGTFAAIEPREELSSHFHSQYFRRVLANHFALKASWNWREYDCEEAWMLDTLAWFGVERVSVR